jgi:hypothetical protein
VEGDGRQARANRQSHGPQHWREALSQILIRLSEQQNDIALVLRHDWHEAGRKTEDVTAQERFNVLAIQPDDEVLYVFVVQDKLSRP